MKDYFGSGYVLPLCVVQLQELLLAYYRDFGATSAYSSNAAKYLSIESRN